MKGRKRKPSHLKLVEGNRGKRRTNKREPKPRRVIPSPPEHLPAPALVHWGRFSTLFDRMGVLTEADFAALEMLCCLYQEIVELRAIVAAEGRTYITLNNVGAEMKRPNPAVAQLADADRRFHGYLNDFGGTPSGRARLETDNPDADSDPAEKHFG